MCSQNEKVSIRRYQVFGSRTISNYWWGAISLIGGLCFFLAGLYSYYLNFSFVSITGNPITSVFKDFSLFVFLKNNLNIQPDITFFPQGLSMCFYGLLGMLLGTFLCFCIVFKIGCGFTEFNKEQGAVRIFRLSFPGKNRYIDITYDLGSIQCICVKISNSIVPTSQRGVYMRLKLPDNQIRDIPLELYSEKTSLEEVELEAADLSKFLRVSLSIL